MLSNVFKDRCLKGGILCLIVLLGINSVFAGDNDADPVNFCGGYIKLGKYYNKEVCNNDYQCCYSESRYLNFVRSNFGKNCQDNDFVSFIFSKSKTKLERENLKKVCQDKNLFREYLKPLRVK